MSYFQAEDEDATMARRRSRHTENKEYEDPEEGEAERGVYFLHNLANIR